MTCTEQSPTVTEAEYRNLFGPIYDGMSVDAMQYDIQLLRLGMETQKPSLDLCAWFELSKRLMVAKEHLDALKALDKPAEN